MAFDRWGEPSPEHIVQWLYDSYAASECGPPPVVREEIESVIRWRWTDGDCAEESFSVILRLKDGRYLAGEGSCDTTGWDCQAGIDYHVADDYQGAFHALSEWARPAEWLDAVTEGVADAGTSGAHLARMAQPEGPVKPTKPGDSDG